MTERSLILRVTMIVMLAIAIWQPWPAYADHPQTLTIAAANSLKEALRAILPIFEKEQGNNVEVKVVWGPSQSLRDQIAQGAPIDVFLPSSLEEIDQLETKGLTLQGTKQVYAETALVLITQATVPAQVPSLRDLPGSDVRRIAIGDPKTSSVGKFAAQVLKNSRLDSDLKSRYVYAEHSGAVLNLVATGEAEVGLVYRTDAVKNKNVHILAEAPPDTHSPIVYGLATVWTSKNPPMARHFGKFMLSSKIQDILKSYGFEQASLDVNSVQR
jgi:molybdate transport system substrate-binding protein